MNTYPNGSKCSGKDMDQIIKERDEMNWGIRRMYSPAINSVLRREVERILNTQAIEEWQHEDWIIKAIQQDLNFTDAQIKTQLKNLCRYAIEKQYIRRPGKRQIIGTEYRHLR